MSRPSGQITDLAPVEDWEYDAFMVRMEEEHWRLLFEILWQTGIRVQEGLSILKTDLEVRPIRSALGTEESPGVNINREKRTDHLRQFLPLTPDLYNRLKQYISTHRIRGERIFPYSYSGAWLALKKACVKAGIRTTIHPHLTRHGAGYRLAGLNLGLSPLAHQKLVAEALGHKSMKTAEIYFNPPPRTVINALKKINEPMKIEVPKIEVAAPASESVDFMDWMKRYIAK